MLTLACFHRSPWLPLSDHTESSVVVWLFCFRRAVSVPVWRRDSLPRSEHAPHILVAGRIKTSIYKHISVFMFVKKLMWIVAFTPAKKACAFSLSRYHPRRKTVVNKSFIIGQIRLIFTSVSFISNVYIPLVAKLSQPVAKVNLRSYELIHLLSWSSVSDDKLFCRKWQLKLNITNGQYVTIHYFS